LLGRLAQFFLECLLGPLLQILLLFLHGIDCLLVCVHAFDLLVQHLLHPELAIAQLADLAPSVVQFGLGVDLGAGEVTLVLCALLTACEGAERTKYLFLLRIKLLQTRRARASVFHLSLSVDPEENLVLRVEVNPSFLDVLGSKPELRLI
jgi:hypothetical protein